MARPGGLRLRLEDPSAWLELPLERLGECGLCSVSMGAEEKKEAMLIPLGTRLLVGESSRNLCFGVAGAPK